MWPLIALAGLFFVASEDATGGSSSGSGGAAPATPGTAPSQGQKGGAAPLASDASVPLEMTCDEAIALLDSAIQGPVSQAIILGTVPDALRSLAKTLEARAASEPDERVAAGYQIAAHCLEVRADSLPATPAVPSGAPAATPVVSGYASAMDALSKAYGPNDFKLRAAPVGT